MEQVDWAAVRARDESRSGDSGSVAAASEKGQTSGDEVRWATAGSMPMHNVPPIRLRRLRGRWRVVRSAVAGLVVVGFVVQHRFDELAGESILVQ